MNVPKVLLVYQSDENCTVQRSIIRDEGGEIEEAHFESRTAVTPANSYTLVLFDVHRPAEHLLDILQAWQEQAPGVPLIVTGSRTSPANRNAILEMGAAAYLTKPLRVPELVARVRAALRHSRMRDRTSRELCLSFGTVDLEARMLRASGGHVRLTATECGILEHLALHINKTVPRTELVHTLWGDDPQKGVHSLRLFIRKLRRKLEPDPAHPVYLVTEPTVGYRLQEPGESR